MFGRPKLNSEEYEKLHMQLLALQGQVDRLTNRLEGIDDALKAFKGRFYQHLAKEEDPQDTSPKGLNTPFTGMRL